MGPISRRRLLQRSGYAALGVLASSTAWVRQGYGASGGKWASLARQLDGALLRPGDAAYATTGLTENSTADHVRPAAIALCADTKDVQSCIRWARQENEPLVAQSGGHSFAGYSTTTGLMISVRPIDGVRFDRQSGAATIGSGVQLGDLYNSLFSHGVFIPGGRCTSVGIAGYALGGGFGFETRQFGLTSDLMLETEIVTADGEVLICNETENADLFWACRGGGGGNFGINTSFKMRALPVVPTTYGKLAWSFDDAEAVWTALQSVAMTAPDGLGMRNGIARSRPSPGAASRGEVTAVFFHFGSVEEARALLAPAIDAARPTEVTILSGTLEDATEFAALDSAPNAFLSKSAYAEAPIPAEGVGTLVDFFKRWPASARGCSFALHSVGGVSNKVARSATAYVHRGAQAVFEYEARWFAETTAEQVAENVAWLEALDRALQPYVNGESYQNFIDPTLADWQRAYYAENFERLVAVKRRHDPDDVFRFPQGIPG